MKGLCHVSSLMRSGSELLSEVGGGPIIWDHGAYNRSRVMATATASQHCSDKGGGIGEYSFVHLCVFFNAKRYLNYANVRNILGLIFIYILIILILSDCVSSYSLSLLLPLSPLSELPPFWRMETFLSGKEELNERWCMPLKMPEGASVI